MINPKVGEAIEMVDDAAIFNTKTMIDVSVLSILS